MKKEAWRAPVRARMDIHYANSSIGGEQYKPFVWFCMNCTQPLTGKYPIRNTDLPDDFPECQICGLSEVRT